MLCDEAGRQTGLAKHPGSAADSETIAPVEPNDTALTVFR